MRRFLYFLFDTPLVISHSKVDTTQVTGSVVKAESWIRIYQCRIGSDFGEKCGSEFNSLENCWSGYRFLGLKNYRNLDFLYEKTADRDLRINNSLTVMLHLFAFDAF